MGGIRLFISLPFALAIALVGCSSEPPKPTTDPAVIAALAPACSGHAVTAAGAIETSGATNHLVLLGTGGATFEMSDWLPAAWSPPTLADAELVACAPTSPTKTVLEVCPYIGSDITRYGAVSNFTVFEAATASRLATFTITAEPRECAPTENADLTVLEGTIDADLVTAYLTGLVEHGVFIDPNGPGWSPGPDWTPGPGQTSEPSRPGQAVELRQALADGRVSVTGTGDGLQSLDLQLTSQTGVDLEVTIEAGTLLEPRAGGTQRMVVTQTQTEWLAAYDSTTASLDVACVEMHQDQPTGDDSFHVLPEPTTGDLTLLLKAPEFNDASDRVQQFAVWTITNNPRRNDYVGLKSGFDIFGSGPDDEEIGAIRDLFDAAGIDTGSYRALH